MRNNYQMSINEQEERAIQVSNNSQVSNNMDLSNLSSTELQIMQERIMNARIKQLENVITNTANEVEKMKEKQEKTLETAINSMRVQGDKYGYVTLTKFGSMFHNTISNKNVGKLLRVVGLANKKLKDTTPTMEANKKGFAMSRTNSEYSSFVWHYGNCLKVIDAWLEKEGMLEEFYGCKDLNTLEKFIDDLHWNYVE